MIQRSQPLKEFLSGIRDELPILFGTAPFGLIYGVLAVEAGLAPAAAQAMSAIVFAGSAQFILTQLVAEGAPALVMVLTIAVVNLRHALYSASMAPYLRRLPLRWKLLLAYLLTDEAYAVSIVHYRETDARMEPDQPDTRYLYFLGAGLGLWTTWQLSTAAGVFLGGQVPASWSLDFTLALTFIALVAPAVRDRPSLAAALSAGMVALIGANWPYKLGLMAAALAGILTGLLFETALQAQREEQESVT